MPQSHDEGTYRTVAPFAHKKGEGRPTTLQARALEWSPLEDARREEQPAAQEPDWSPPSWAIGVRPCATTTGPAWPLRSTRSRPRGIQGERCRPAPAVGRSFVGGGSR